MKKPPLEEKNILNVEEAVELYGMSRRRFRKLLESTGLPFVAAYGKRKVIIRAELEAYLQSRPDLKEALMNRALMNRAPMNRERS